MKRGRSIRLVLIATAALATVLAIIVAGCSHYDDPVSVLPASSSPIRAFDKMAATASIDTLDGYAVRFDGRVFADGQTTFSYTVFGLGNHPALSHFRIELPACAPELAAYEPTNSVSINVDPQAGIYGIEWHLSVEPDDFIGRSYSITFPGDVPLGVVRGVVQSGDLKEAGEIAGPCSGFTIAGTVYVDADSNGVKDGADELGIAQVAVALLKDDTVVELTMTDLDGAYSFRKVAGAYAIKIRPVSDGGDFNLDLAESFAPTGPASLQVVVGPDSFGNDFGFLPLAGDIIVDLETGVLASNGENVRFWKKELRAALGNGPGNASYDPVTLLAFISEIQGLALPDPYQFTPGNELSEALAFLGNSSHDPVEELKKELLAAEFNHVSGRGLINEDDLQAVLIAWGESLILEFAPASKKSSLAGASEDKARVPAGGGDVQTAIDLFGLLNTGGGGDPDE
jgi:hypothetical protein